MPTSSDEVEHMKHTSRTARMRARNERFKRTYSCSPSEDNVRNKKLKRQMLSHCYKPCQASNFQCQAHLGRRNINESFPYVEQSTTVPTTSKNCRINSLPEEILLKIFSYLPLGMLLHTVPRVCKKWEVLAMDWTLWKSVEDLTIKNMVISTSKLRSLLRTIPKLRKLELILRNDTEELLNELLNSYQNLEVLKLDRCYRSTLQMNILPQTVTSILETCPKLKTVMLTDTYFHSKSFYRCLAQKFKTMERINVTCTTKSEMNVFVENLKETVPEVEFQRVPMMGRADGKQIYWGPILGLVVRPIPTSPFHQQYMHDNYPNYAF